MHSAKSIQELIEKMEHFSADLRRTPKEFIDCQEEVEAELREHLLNLESRLASSREPHAIREVAMEVLDTARTALMGVRILEDSAKSACLEMMKVLRQNGELLQLLTAMRNRQRPNAAAGNAPKNNATN